MANSRLSSSMGASENLPRTNHTPVRRLSASGSSTPLRRVSSYGGQPSGRVVGLGLIDTMAVDLPDACDMPWQDRSPTEDSIGAITAPASPSHLSPQLLYSPEAGTSSSVVAVAVTDAALRSPRSSALLDPGTAAQSARRPSISHASHSSAGSASSFHSSLSIRMDEPVSAPSSRNTSNSSSYWLDSPLLKSSPEEKSMGLPRVERRSRSPPPRLEGIRNVLSGLLGGLMSIVSPGAADPNGQAKRSLPARLLTLAYVVFSLLYLTSRLVAPYTPFASPLELVKRSAADAVVSPPVMPLLGGRTSDDVSPLSAWHHPYRFSKMHSKLQSDTHEGILPFLYRATDAEPRGEVTACVYTNEAWLSELPEFVKRWNGPISAVFETAAARGTPDFEAAIASLAALRESQPLVKQFADFHVVVTTATSEAQIRRLRTRLVNQPIATNYQLNIARFFSRTPAVWLVADARVVPSSGLRKRLNNESLVAQVTRKADAIVVPTFGAIRSDADWKKLSSSSASLLRGQSIFASDKFPSIAKQAVAAHRDSLPVPYDKWPKKKSALIGLASNNPPPTALAGAESVQTGPVWALWDRSWDANRGPSNWPLWRRTPGDARLDDGPEMGGGAGLGVDGTVGGGQELYKVADYDLHYAPAVMIGRNQQPWCTERFGASRAACIYQMYLSGAEMWVVPDEWAFTLEPLERNSTSTIGLDKTLADAERLQDSIASRLYTKYHQEACMHYGREFLSLNQWESNRASHLRATCARVLSSWGVGISMSD